MASVITRAVTSSSLFSSFSKTLSSRTSHHFPSSSAMMAFSVPLMTSESSNVEFSPVMAQTSCKSFYGTSKLQEMINQKKEDVATGKVSADYNLAHPLWVDYELDDIKYTHREPVDFLDKLAFYTIKTIRFNFDILSGFKFLKHNETIWLNRIIFLETIAAIPGSIGATLRHLGSLRRMKRDHGWIHTLLEEAENERMHLLTALKLRQPGWFMKSLVFLSQGIFYNFFFVSYLFSPSFCHRLVGYLEEEAVLTYTKCLSEIDHGVMKVWAEKPAPDIARHYWHLSDRATMRDVIRVIRADEAHHRDVNHTFSSMPVEADNPFPPGH